MSSKGKTSAQAGGGAASAPKLRFPEFVGHQLQALQLADVTAECVERNGDGRTSSQFMGVSKVEGIVPMEERIVAADTARYKFVRKNWFAYNPMRLNIGSIARWQGDDDILVSPDYVVFKCKGAGSRRLDPAYLDHFRRSDAWENFVSEKGDGSVRVRIYYKDIARLHLALPSIPEQRKIADCLDSADALIAVQGRKVEELRAQKKALMQQLFPRGGETQPRLRFPEFEATGEWEIKPLSEIATYENGKAYEKDIVEKGKYIVVNSRFISTDGAVRKYTNADYLIANVGDVLMVLSDLPRGRALAKCYFVEANDRYAVNQRICRLKGKRLDSKFMFFILDRNLNLLAYDDGQTQTHLSKGNVLECPLCFPPNKAEQQRIADCLTSLDDLIAAESLKLDTLKTHKKSLMQQLFPEVREDDA
ncbi:MAG: restriction endonuclease subunit S [Alphaproteobacteria bacterium]